MSDSSQTILTEAAETEFHSLYWEEVHKIVDGVIADAINGHLTTQAAAEKQACAAVLASHCASDNKRQSIHVLLFSSFPCAGLADCHSLAPCVNRWITNRGSYDPLLDSHSDFPFNEFAAKAMQQDVVFDLCARPEYSKLAILTDPLTQAKKTCRLNSREPNEANTSKPQWKKSAGPDQE